MRSPKKMTIHQKKIKDTNFLQQLRDELDLLKKGQPLLDGT